MAKRWKNLVSSTKSVTKTSADGSSNEDEEDEEELVVGATAVPTAIVERPVTIGSQTISVFQQRLLIQTWKHMNKSGSVGGIGGVIFKKILDKRPELRQMLAKASVVSTFSGGAGCAGPNALAEHKRLLTELLDRTISNLDNLASISEECLEIGKSHAHLHGRNQFQPDIWDKFGQVMLESFTQLETIRRHRELVKAWMVLISFLIDKLRHGYVMRMKQLQFQIQKGEMLGSTAPGSAAVESVLVPRCSSAEEARDGSGAEFLHKDLFLPEELEREERVSD